MSKQTVEEAAIIASMPYGTRKAMLIVTGFEFGAAWQREQGIDWINEGFPRKQENGISKECLFKQNGYYGVHYGYFSFKENIWFSYTINSIIRGIVTHWAYINLPKTEK